MRRTPRLPALLLTALLPLGCAAPSAAIESVDGRALAPLDPDAPLWLDLTAPDRGYLLAPDLPLDRLMLVCPNGAAMSGTAWAAENAWALPEPGVGFSVALDEDVAASAMGACRYSCHRCEDGVTICSPENECEPESVEGMAQPVAPSRPSGGADESSPPSSGAGDSGRSGAPSGGATPGARPAR